MNILMVSAHFNQRGDTVPIGGVQTHITEVTEALRSMGHGVRWSYKSETNDIDMALQSWAHGVIAHDFVSLLWGCHLPQVVTFHGWEGQCPPNPEVVRVRQQVARKATATVNVGRYIEAHYGTPADATIWGAASEPEAPLCVTGKNTALWVGRLAPDTCPEQAFLTADRMGWTLDVCGDGPLRAGLAEKYPWARFHGFVERPWGQPYSGAEHVFATGYLSTLEAMMRRRIPIAFYHNPLREDYLRMMPSFLPVAADASTMLSLLRGMNSFDREQIVEQNYQWAKAQTWQSIAEMYINLLKKERV